MNAVTPMDSILASRRYEPNSNQAVQGDFTSLPPITVSNDDSRMNAISELRLTNNPKHLPIAPSSLPTHPLARRCVGDDVSVVYANATDILTLRSANYSSTINNLQSPSSATTSPISIVSQVTPLRPKRIHVDFNRIGGVSNTIDKNLNIGGVTSESVTNFDSSARSVDKVVLNKRKTQEFSPSILTVGEVHPPVSIPVKYTTFTLPKEEVKDKKWWSFNE